MKNITTIITSILVASSLLVSCDLNKESQDLIPLDKSIESVEGAIQWDNGLMAALRPRLFGDAAIIPQEAQADMLNAHQASDVRRDFKNFHAWKSLKSDDDALDELYLSYYAALSDVNIMLEELPKIPVREDNKAADQATIKRIMGDAHFARAFYYFNLTMRWGMKYNQATKDKDLSVPLFDKFRPLEKKARATNAEVWPFILKDLSMAEKELSDVAPRAGSNVLTSDVAVALKARVYLYMNDMPEALKTAEELIKSNRYPLISQKNFSDPDDDEFRLMWHKDSGKEQIFQPYINKPDEIGGTLNLYGADLSTTTYFKENNGVEVQFNKPSYLPAGWLFTEVYDKDHDRRFNVYFESTHTSTSKDHLSKDKVYVISKFKGNPKYRTLDSNLWGGYVPNGIQAAKPFRIAEQYLIAAEAAEALGKTDLSLKYLNDLRVSRGLEPVDATDLRKNIRLERIRELAFEGFRLWDLRRWGEGVHRHTPQPTARGYLDKNYKTEFDIPADNPKFIWAIPSNLCKKINKKLIQNPGWN